MLQRKSRSAKTYCDKIYINKNGLCVNGSQLELELRPSQTLTTNSSSKKIHIKPISAQPPQEKHVRRAEVSRKEPKKKTLDVSVTVYQNNQACSERLRGIYETVEVAEEFKRLLGIDEIASRPEKKGSRTLANVSNVYDEFFGVHYRHLREIISLSDQ